MYPAGWRHQIQIYIPICFYFNQIRKLISLKISSIYIPICFYFNIACIISTSPPLSFTFQYVSILIYYSVWFICERFTFTFQYVSILIEVQEAVDYLDEIIYIPICFYFNAEDYYYTVTWNEFTFQYVSILIFMQGEISEDEFDLHSNMFLF